MATNCLELRISVINVSVDCIEYSKLTRPISPLPVWDALCGKLTADSIFKFNPIICICTVLFMMRHSKKYYTLVTWGPPEAWWPWALGPGPIGQEGPAVLQVNTNRLTKMDSFFQHGRHHVHPAPGPQSLLHNPLACR